MGDSDDENYVTFGQPLDPLDEENLPRKKPVTLEDQYATDAQGRRRFHGAFTGGFSAGYFNTVGTRDGWRPQQFKSSRSSKAGSITQRPEDFMDEEDTGEFGIAPTGIRATSEFTDHGKGTKRERPRVDNDGPIPGVPVLKELLKPVTDTVGVALLKKMGWKPGQGVGPRMTRREKKKTRERNEKKKVYGCLVPGREVQPAESSSDSSDDGNEEILFAPDDYEPYRANPKDNYFGIGYSGLDRHSVLGHVNLFDAPTFQLLEKNKKLSIKGQAFGVGAFEADDEDIYAREDMSRYDFTLGPESKTKTRWSEAKAARPNCLEGFVPAKNPPGLTKHYPPPILPKDYKPIHAVRKSRFSPAEDSSREAALRKGLGRHDLNATDRSAIFGECSTSKQQSAPEPEMADKSSQPTSPAANIISRTLNLQGRDKIKERENLENQQKKASWLDKLTTTTFIRGGVESSHDTAGSLKNLSDFKSNLQPTDSTPQLSKPFALDEEKQRRFEKYLELAKSNQQAKLSTIQPLSMTEWERQRETEEFELAARLSENTKPPTNEPVEHSDPMVNAAKMKMFGKLTRTVEPWQPCSIVCKRFNIPEPKTTCEIPERNRKKYSVFDSLDFTNDTKFQKATNTADTYKEPNIPYNPPEKSRDKVADSMKIVDIDVGSGKSSEKIRNFEVTYEKVFGKTCAAESTVDDEKSTTERNDKQVVDSTESADKIEKKDLYKAIFLSSSEDEEESDKETDDVNSDTVKSLLIGKSGEINSQRNNSPPRGIFAKLDLDDLVKPGKAGKVVDSKETRGLEILDDDEGSNVNESTKVSGGVPQGEMEILPEMYGPALPTLPPRQEQLDNPEIVQRPVFRSVVIPKLDSEDKELKWVEKKKAKKEKKKHKHKEKSKKYKRKSKKSKR